MITDKELETMIKIENLVGKFEKLMFGEDKDKEVVVNWYDNSKTVITIEDFVDYMNIVDRIIKDKECRKDK